VEYLVDRCSERVKRREVIDSTVETDGDDRARTWHVEVVNPEAQRFAQVYPKYDWRTQRLGVRVNQATGGPNLPAIGLGRVDEAIQVP
jgi:hypothetical protein